MFHSKKYAHGGWYVGVKKNGEVKNGRKTWQPWGQKAILFVSRRAFAKAHPLKQIVNRHGFQLAIAADGKVRGRKRILNSLFTLLKISTY